MENKDNNFVDDYRKLVKSIGTITKNKKGFGYTYLELVKLYDEIEPKLEEHNFIVLSTSRATNGVLKRKDSAVVIQKDEKGNPILTSAREYESPCYEIKTELVHSSGRAIECNLPLFVDDIDPQALGSAITYMRRYSIFIILGIKTQDDEGAAGSARDKTRRMTERPELPENPEEIATFLARCENPKIYYGELKSRADVPAELKNKLYKIMYPK